MVFHLIVDSIPIHVCGFTKTHFCKRFKDILSYGYCAFLATLTDERNGYLSGIDILCDGGSTNGKKYKKYFA